MKVAFITRSTLFKVPGGDTIQITETATHLRELGVAVKIYLSNEKIRYEEFDLLHFFNLTRPADILYHAKKTKTPYVISPVLVDYAEYDQYHRHGFSGWVLKRIPSPEYVKTISRWVLLKDKLQSKQYLWKGQRRSIVEVLEKARMILPNSVGEYNRLNSSYPVSKPSAIIHNGINEGIFRKGNQIEKDKKLVVCAARIEGIKNQMNLIKALNNTDFTLVLIGEPSPNQKQYFEKCKRVAGRNVIFTGRISQDQLAKYFQKAKVHVLPSWFETCGLSSLEAAATGCNIVVTEKGFTRDYFSDHAFYCSPENVESIYRAVSLAASSSVSDELREKIVTDFTWSQAAKKTLEAYKTCLNN